MRNIEYLPPAVEYPCLSERHASTLANFADCRNFLESVALGGSDNFFQAVIQGGLAHGRDASVLHRR